MIQRLFLIPDVSGTSAFDQKKLTDAIQGLNRVMNWREGEEALKSIETLFECELEPSISNRIPLPIRISKDLKCVSIGAYDDAGLEAALEIQRRYGTEIFAFSEESSPDVISLAGINSVEELATQLELR